MIPVIKIIAGIIDFRDRGANAPGRSYSPDEGRRRILVDEKVDFVDKKQYFSFRCYYLR